MKKKMPDQDALPFFFICGNGRSGTTLLRTLLDAHPQVNIPLECPLIINLSFGYARIGKWNDTTRNNFLHDLFKQTFFQNWKLSKADAAAALKEMPEGGGFSDAVRRIYSAYPSLFPKEKICLLGDKTIVHSLYTKKLLELFPEARFIHLVRDPRDRNLSLSEGRNTLASITLKTLKWREVQRSIGRTRQRHPGRFLVIRYEDLASKPEDVMEKLCDFLGIRFEPQILTFHERNAGEKLYEKAFADTWQHRLFKPINNDRCGVWRKELAPHLAQLTEYLSGTDAALLGYPLECGRPSVGLRLLILPWLFLHQLVVWRRIATDLLPFRPRNFLLGRGPLLWVYRKAFGKKE